MPFRIIRRDAAVESVVRLPHSRRERQQPVANQDDEKATPVYTPEEQPEQTSTADALGYLEVGQLRRHQATRLAGPHAARPSLLQKHEALLLWYRQQERSE